LGSSLAAIALVGWAGAAPAPATLDPPPGVALDTDDPVASRNAIAARELVPARPARVETEAEARHAIPMIDLGGGERRIDDEFPSLAAWIHPVAASAEHMPARVSRHFGAERAGIERAECGEGHCGVDLDGPRGRPIVSVASGTVVRVERAELGRDGRSGRYVRIQHEDGTLTAYMHLDEVAEELRVGSRVDAGQYVGTLGATAVYSAAPHLHFSLEIPVRRDQRGDHTQTRYVDPAPFLVRATIVPVRERRPQPAS
ncbi:MAG: M23 family metallopeptidase, partial [Kofleriaceae bacterium]